jgi:chemotaxis protein methyltransferase CheR
MAFTSFLRDTHTLDLLAQYVLPDLKRNQFIRVWDAGCAMGPEPYFIAMIFRENMEPFLFRNVLIYATDIDESSFGVGIRRGVYSEAELGQISRDLFNKYFVPNGAPGHFQVREELRRAVHFQRHDLLSLQPVREDFGLVVCKNVLLHLAPAQRADVVRMFHRALAQDGYFLMEQTQRLPSSTERLFRRVTEVAQLYQKV